jgi:hypothetical protein
MPGCDDAWLHGRIDLLERHPWQKTFFHDASHVRVTRHFSMTGRIACMHGCVDATMNWLVDGVELHTCCETCFQHVSRLRATRQFSMTARIAWMHGCVGVWMHGCMGEVARGGTGAAYLAQNISGGDACVHDAVRGCNGALLPRECTNGKATTLGAWLLCFWVQDDASRLWARYLLYQAPITGWLHAKSWMATEGQAT